MKNMKQVITPLLGLLTVASAFALEPLKESTDVYMNLKNDRDFAKADVNGNGKIEEEEAGRQWRQNKKLDKNGDAAVDAEEWKTRTLKYVSSSGKQLRDVCFKRTEAQDVYLDFYFPDVDESKKKPVVLYTHGGGWSAGSRHGAGNASFDVVHKALLNKGFCVVSVGYRLVKKNGDTAMRDCVIDSKDALRFISAYQKELGIDPNRIYTFGDSAGAHIAQMVLLAPPDSLKGDPELAKYTYKTVAGVSWYGPCDFQDPQLFNHNDRPKFRDRFGARIMGKNSKPSDKKALYREMSPVNYLTKDSPALLLIQGDKDTTIPVKQAYRMQDLLKTIDAPVEILIVKNAGHNWRSVDAPISPTRNEIIKKTVTFFTDNM